MPFVGKALPFGGTSADHELDAALPDEHLSGEWSDFAQKLFFEGSDGVNSWPFVDDDAEVVQQKLNLLRGLLGSFELDHERKMAVGGWMLSEMLATVPEA